MATRMEALEAAFDELEGQGDEKDTSTPEPTENITDRGDGLGDGETVTEEVAEPTEKPARGRDSSGKFTAGGDKSPPDNKQQIPADRAAPDQKSEEKPVTTVRAPVSWRPELRERFGKLEPEVQAEISRREREMDTFVRQSAGVRQFAEGFHRILSPYEAMIRAEGGNMHSAVDNLIKTAYHLRTAPPQQKAVMVAQMIMQHGVDLEMLDQAVANLLQGKQNQFRQDPAFQFLQQELAPIKQFVGQLQGRQRELDQSSHNSVVSELDTFAADPKNEFFEDVRELMADFLEAAANRGVKMSLQDAYARATLAHPTISDLVTSRRMAASAAQRSAAARRARNASASLPSGAPAGAAGEEKPKSRIAQLSAAWDEAESQE